MSNDTDAQPRSAGAMLRMAREAKGWHIGALASALKVTPAKLEALESDRLDALPDATFARALAQSVCRQLKTDPAPVLALMPAAASMGLGAGRDGINTPFREHSPQRDGNDTNWLRHPMLWGSVVLLAAALVVYVVPVSMWAQWLSVLRPDSASVPVVVPPPPMAPAASAAGGLSGLANAPLGAGSAPAAAAELPKRGEAPTLTMAPIASAPMVETVFPAPGPVQGVLGAPPMNAALTSAVVIRVNEASWVEVNDAQGKSLLSRLLQRGESVGLDGSFPFKLKIGNAAATELSFRGQPIDLRAVTRDNIARLELQ